VLAEMVEILTALWSEPDVSYMGLHFTLDGAQCDPKPLQKTWCPEVFVREKEQELGEVVSPTSAVRPVAVLGS
jgi:alkanesulfonate monooxygenase SsuD/methylene tetrahydromethanopterin reductase-like flavin-dependent oxidoreductase (luciferase family)